MWWEQYFSNWWEPIAYLTLILVFAVPITAIIVGSPPMKALGKVIEAFAVRIAGRARSDPKLIERIEILERELSRRERGERLSKRIGKEETEKLKQELVGSQGTVTILFSDIEDFSRFTDRGDDLAHEVLQIHNRIIRDQIKDHGGQEVKNYGDGFMVSFTSARKAVQCAIEIQDIFKTYNFKHVDPIRVRVGINSGEPIKESGDYIGRAVNLTARIADSARGGEIWVSDLVKNLVGPSRDYQFINRGTHHLQGFHEPQELYEVVRIEALESPDKRELEIKLSELEAKLKREMGS